MPPKQESQDVVPATGVKTLAAGTIAIGLIGAFLMKAVATWAPADLVDPLMQAVPLASGALFACIVRAKQDFANFNVKRVWRKEQAKQIGWLTKQIRRCDAKSKSHHANKSLSTQYARKQAQLEQLLFTCEHAKVLETPWEAGLKKIAEDARPSDADLLALEQAAQAAAAVEKKKR